MITTLITGGAGFIGSTIADRLIQSGNNVIIVDDFSTGQLSNVPDKANVIKLDIGGKDALHELCDIFTRNDIKYVFHCASIPRTQYSVENPIICNQSNVNGTLNLLEAIRITKARIDKVIHSSSCGIYGQQESCPINEEAPKNMGTPYSVQKYIQEKYFELYCNLYGVPSIMLRYFNVYGTRKQSESGSYPNVLAAFSKQKREHNKLYITGDGLQSRDMVHVDDVVNANILAMVSGFNKADYFNIGTGEHMSINDVAKYFECPVEYIPERPGEAKHLYADNSKALRLLGWKPKISYDDGIRKYLNS